MAPTVPLAQKDSLLVNRAYREHYCRPADKVSSHRGHTVPPHDPGREAPRLIERRATIESVSAEAPPIPTRRHAPLPE